MENQIFEKKSLRLFISNNPDWKSLARDCVCLANARGGVIAEHRLTTLILEDIENYPNSRIEEIHQRIGKEIPLRRVRKTLYSLVKEEKIKTQGGKKFRQYFIDKNLG